MFTVKIVHLLLFSYWVGEFSSCIQETDTRLDQEMQVAPVGSDGGYLKK